MKIFFTIFFCLLFTPLGFAAQHPIDDFEGRCVQKNQDPKGRLNCLTQTYQLWSTDVDKYYHLLLGMVNGPDRATLEKAQQDWSSFKDVEFKRINVFFSQKDPSLRAQMETAAFSAVEKQRALQLEGIYNQLSQARQSNPSDQKASR